MRRDPARDGLDFGENDTISWRRPRRRPGPYGLERETLRAHALAQLARSARGPGAVRPGRGAAHVDEPTVVASAANHAELAEILAGEIAAAAGRPRSARAGALPRTSPTVAPVSPAARGGQAASALPVASAAQATALAPLLDAAVRRAPMRMQLPATAPGRARPRVRHRARARVRTAPRRRGLPLAALVILMLLWAAVYQQAWSALSMGDRCRAAWETLGLAPREARPGPIRPG